MYLIAIAVGLIMLLILWSRIELKFLTTTEYKISSKKLGSDFHDVKFVVLSDLHNHSLGKNNKRLIEKIDSISPDFILIAGDMVTKRQFCVPSNAFTLLKILSNKYKIYYGYGNHEQYFEQLLDNLQESNLKEAEIIRRKNLFSTWVEYKKRLKSFGIEFLDNNQISLTIGDINRNANRNQNRKNMTSELLVCGLSLDMAYYVRPNHKGQASNDNSTVQKPQSVQEFLKATFGKKAKDIFHILIAHNPIYFEDYVAWGADLILSGHVHGGLVRLPFLGGLISPSVKLFPKYDAGRFTKDGKTMIISRGLGTHSNMPRIFNPPELIVVHISHEAEEA